MKAPIPTFSKKKAILNIFGELLQNTFEDVGLQLH